MIGPVNRAYIFIGSNVDRERNYVEALRRLRSLGRILQVSSVYETTPVGGRGAEDYYNGAVLLETELNAAALKRSLRTIESQMGRVRQADRYAPRTIDLDLVLFNRDRVDDGELHLPDPLILERPFLAAALAELSPEYVHPVVGRTLAELAQQLKKPEGDMRLEPRMTASVQKLFSNTDTGEVSNA